MSGEPSIKQLLAAKGIETRPSPHASCRELWRDDQLLGHFTAGGAVAQFLPEHAPA